jgi:Protein of unknown function (DUF2281)
MQNTMGLEKAVLENLRLLPPEKQQEVLDFVEFLRQKFAERLISPHPSLEQIAALTVVERRKLLAPYIPDTAEDFRTDPALTEFSVLDTEGWELEDE